MKYDPNRHNRRSIRLKGYDYSNPGYYFITICCQKHQCFFGYVDQKEMVLNEAGHMIEKWYFALESKFPYIHCHEMVIMPNHIHFIIQIVGANQRVRPQITTDEVATTPIKPIGSIIQWFKTMSTNEYIRGVKQYDWKRFDGKLWQRNYWDHIVRNEQSFQRISQYIRTNPERWNPDF